MLEAVAGRAEPSVKELCGAVASAFDRMLPRLP